MYERVVVPLDGSRLAEEVFDHLGELTHAGTMFFPTMVIERAFIVGIGGHAVSDEGMDVGRRLDALSYLRSAMEANGLAGAKFKLIVKVHLNPARAIAEAAVEQRADLIAMTSHGRTRLSRLVLGSVAWAVLKLSPVTVKVFSGKKLALAS